MVCHSFLAKCKLKKWGCQCSTTHPECNAENFEFDENLQKVNMITFGYYIKMLLERYETLVTVAKYKNKIK